ncbi:cadherin-related family member 2 [Antennarius striatus]|uniref:cadherin-related family member 2 n=1 Tax=Antennarius striatus TaxID=241820 RepID=UPI0035B16C6F
MSCDMEGIARNLLLLSMVCLISLTNANTGPYIYNTIEEVCEDVPIGGYAFAINATDRDNDTMTYSLHGPNATYFKVNENTGVVFVEKELDRETYDIFEIIVHVSDGPNTTPQKVKIVLKEANDNRPVFQEATYDVDIPEDIPVGTTLFTVHATDADSLNAGVVRYNIDTVIPEAGENLFSISSVKGIVTLKGPLNYTSMNQFYQLKINATDGGGKCHYNETKFLSSIAFSFITVNDVPDLDPRFIGLPYEESVVENSVVGKTVLKVTAMDQDTGINDDIIYSIENSSADGLFNISREDGVICILSNIDREIIGDVVELIVKGTESQRNIHGVFASVTALVRINILDINDNEPEFFKCNETGDEHSCVKWSHFTGEVFEHSLGPISFNMKVKDQDKGSKSRLILEGADKEVFSVEPELTMSDNFVQLVVKQTPNLDFEDKQQMVLQVIAIDDDKPSFRSSATVTINIKDINDMTPTFPQSTYRLNVSEHSPVGMTIANITAEDPDTMDKDRLIYKLLPASILQYFDVDQNSGRIYVKSQTLLDREARSLYTATLQAMDTGGKVGTTMLEITLTDINDQYPVMNRDSYLVFVEEGGAFEVRIEATDADDPDTVNSQIVYDIVPSRYSDNFTINPDTGLLTNSGILNREAIDPNLEGKIELNVTATDKGSPPLSTMVTVIINVEDVNDNKPVFNASSYTFQVREGDKGAYAGSVYAEDLDQTKDFNRISFSIIDGSFGSFIIRTFLDKQGYRGDITVDPDIELDYESTRKNYILQVEATDLGQLKAIVRVEVNVLDVNDERPEFRPTGPFKVKENTTITEPVGNFLAYDKDGNHSLVYELESIKCRCNGSFTPCNSFIVDPNGEIRVNPELTLDYEQCVQAVIEAQVMDVFTEKGENSSVSTGKVVIDIVDINDNAPQFIFSDSVFVVVSESASKGTSVGEVTATDRDSGEFKEIEFKVVHTEFKDTDDIITEMGNLFDVVTTQQKDIYIGIIQTMKALDITLKGKYLVKVSATDPGGLSTSTDLEIFNVDGRYKVDLGFKLSEAEVQDKLKEIVRALTDATKATVVIVDIRPNSDSNSPDSRSSSLTIIDAYFIYSNGTALIEEEVVEKCSDDDNYPILVDLGLVNIGESTVEPPYTDPLRYIMLGMMAGLIILLAVLTTSLMCTRRNYKRKLKAAKAMNSASMVTSDKEKSGPVVPGTNKYTTEGANPVLNLNIDTAMALNMDEGSSETDKISLNSLDDSDYMTNPESETKSGSQLYDVIPPEYIEPLDAALAQRDQKKINPLMAYNNPGFSTTDL